MAHMFQDQFLNQVQKLSTMQHELKMALAHFRMLSNKILNKYPDIVPEEAPLILLGSKYAMCIDNNDKDIKHTRHISRRINFVWNGEKFKMHMIDWCEGGLQLSEIANNNIGYNNLTPRMKYIMVKLDN